LYIYKLNKSGGDAKLESNEQNAPKKRGRPPKKQESVISETNSNINPSNEYCSISNSLPFSSSYYGIGMTIFDLYSQEQISNLVKDPIGNNEMLREISKILYGCNGTLTNTIDYITAMPTLDKVLVPYGKSKQKKNINIELVTSALRTIKDKEFVRDALYNGMIDGAVFYYFETTNRPSVPTSYNNFDIENIIEINDLGINASIISLPTSYCRIVGIKNNSYVIAFNLEYFTDCSGEAQSKKLRKFPKEIRDAFKNKERQTSNNNWIVLDNTHTIVHKIRSSKNEKWGRPLVLAAIKDILYSDYFTDTKRNVLDEINNKIIYQTFPEGKDKGTCALTKPQQENQHNTVKGAVMNKNNRGGVSFFSVASGTKLDSLDPSNTDIFDSKNEENLNDVIALGLGIAGGLLNGSGGSNYSSQQSNIELLSSQVFQWIESIQYELNKCINLNIVKDSKNYVEIHYLPITHVNKKTMVGFAKELYLQGKGSLALWASACGIPSNVFFALLDKELEDDVENKYPTHETSFTMSKDKEGGRPEVVNPLNPATIATKTSGGNNQKKPSTK
jgi:hypothetical protein